MGNPENCGGGSVVRNDLGQLLVAFSSFYRQSTNTKAEMRALLEGLVICIQKGFLDVEIESNSMVVVRWIQGQGCCPWFHRELLDKIIEVKRNLTISCMPRCVPRGEPSCKPFGLVGSSRLGATSKTWIYI